jgi:PKD repeat protein
MVRRSKGRCFDMNARIGKSLSLLAICVMAVGPGLVFVGCPAPDTTPSLIVSPGSLDFGTAGTTATFQVSKSFSARPMPAFTIRTSAEWVTVTPSTGLSDGPEDPVTITVTVDRGKMEAGKFNAAVVISSVGITREQVNVQAIRELAADFSVDSNESFQNDAVQFADESVQADGASPITTWLWDFGDGTTSSEQNPAHSYANIGKYDVRLTVSSVTASATQERLNYILVNAKQAPKADFAVSDNVVEVFEMVQFINESAPGTKPIMGYLWDFGDGKATSILQHPTHSYDTPGTYAVSLTVASEHGLDMKTKGDFITVLAIPPEAMFTVEPTRTPVLTDTGAPVFFEDISQEGSSPLVSWSWDFGDGEVSADQNPSHIYTDLGQYTVRLTVADSAGGADTVTIVQAITVLPNDMAADFTVNDRTPMVGQSVQFYDRTDPGPGTLVSWTWDLGDGTTSTLRNPGHAYEATGAYTVSLTARNQYGSDTVVKEAYISVDAETALDRYLQEPDEGSFTPMLASLPLPAPLGGPDLSMHILDLNSQTWPPPQITDEYPLGPVVASPSDWQHWLYLIVPPEIRTSTAFLYITGGGNTVDPPYTPAKGMEDELNIIAMLSEVTGAIAVVLPTVPNEPLVFFEDGLSRTEDSIISYTCNEYLNGGHEYWPLLLPMVKSAVEAMDATQVYAAAAPDIAVNIQDFVVSGASKRGWTTWLTGAADNRVRAIAPLVIDVLNMDDQMNHHFQAYNGYLEVVQDYVGAIPNTFPVFNRFDTPEGEALRGIIDPYSYLARLDMPKMIINATGDEFFVPDSAQFYFHSLLGEQNNMRYMANTGHSMGERIQDVGISLLNFFAHVVANVPMPTFTWSFPEENIIEVDTSTSYIAPIAVTLWTATISGPTRDFRFAITGDIWTDAPVTDPDSDGIYTVEVPTPVAADTWTAFYVDVTYPTIAEPDVYSTEVRVTPAEMPFDPPPAP